MLQTAETAATGLYSVWKIERKIWLEGQSAMQAHVMPEAIIIPPFPMPPQRMDTLLEVAKRAQSFEEVEFSKQEFLNLGDTVMITYRTSAKHRRFRQRYIARCMTTYIRVNGELKIASHSHFKLPKR